MQNLIMILTVILTFSMVPYLAANGAEEHSSTDNLLRWISYNSQIVSIEQYVFPASNKLAQYILTESTKITHDIPTSAKPVTPYQNEYSRDSMNMEHTVPKRTKKEFMQKWLMVPKAPGGVPVISPFADWDYYYLHKSISWRPEADYQDSFQSVEVPPGFVTDFASIPSVFWSFMPPTERYTHAAIIHDYLYWTQGVQRNVADEILKIGMKELKVESWKIIAIYNAVKTFGGGAWKNNEELKAQGEKRFLKRFPDDPRVTWDQWKKQDDVFAN